MSRDGDVRAAVAAGVLGARSSGDAMLRSVCDVALAVFGARACSVAVHDPEAGELVFAAVAGEGAGVLEGRRIAAGRGLAGWVLASGEPILVEDVSADPRFARDVAESTGYVPARIMAAPLLRDEEDAVGVLSVLDRTTAGGRALAEIDLLGRFAAQAALALEVTRASTLSCSAQAMLVVLCG